MDTAKDKRRIDDLFESGMPPWTVWDPRVGERLAVAKPTIRRWSL
jgi:hypothetical protein